MDVIEKLQRHFYGPSMKEISEESSSSPSIGGSDAEASSGSGEVQLPMPTRASKRRLRAASPPPPHDHDNLNPKRHDLRRNPPRNCRLPPQKSPTPPPVQATDDGEEEEGQVEFKRKRKASECDHGAAKKAQSSKQQEAQSERSVEDIVQALEELPIFQAPSSPQTKSKPKGASAPSDKRKLAGCSSSSSSDLIVKALTGILGCVELVERFKANDVEMRKKEAELIEKQKELDEAKLVAAEAIEKRDAELVEKQKQLDDAIGSVKKLTVENGELGKQANEALASSVEMAARNDVLVGKLSEAEKIAGDVWRSIKRQDARIEMLDALIKKQDLVQYGVVARLKGGWMQQNRCQRAELQGIFQEYQKNGNAKVIHDFIRNAACDQSLVQKWFCIVRSTSEGNTGKVGPA